MKRLFLFFLLLCHFVPVRSVWAQATGPTEVVGDTLQLVQDKYAEAMKNVAATQEVITSVQDGYAEAKGAVQGAIDLGTGLYNDAVDAVEEVKGTYEAGKTFVNAAQSAVTDPNAENAENVLSSGMGLFDKLIGGGSSKKSSRSTTSIKAAQEMTTRVRGKGDAIELELARNEALNAERMNIASVMFAEALILRQELADEKDTENEEVDNIASAMTPAMKMNVRSAVRWSKILRMQATINHFRSSMAMQNFQREGDDDE